MGNANPLDWRLPAIPQSDHPSTFREKALHDAVQEFCRDVERHRPRLLAIVVGGKARWRTVAQSIWRGLRIGEDHQLLDAIYEYFSLQALPPKAQRAWLDQPGKRADIVRAFLPKLEREQERLKLIAKWSV